jgi:hypothetical protein
MTSHELAANAAEALRGLLMPGIWPETRRDGLTAWRTGLAQLLAEEATGTTFQEARLVSLYSRSRLTERQIADAHAYNLALLAAYRELDGDLPAFLAWCDRHAAAAEPVAA